MPEPKVNEKGVSSLLLVYEHPRSWTDQYGRKSTFVNRTLQYNPRTSGKGFYKVLKKQRARIKGTIPYARYMCQRRIIELLTVRSQGATGATAAIQQPGHAGPVEVPLPGAPHTGNDV